MIDTPIQMARYLTALGYDHNDVAEALRANYSPVEVSEALEQVLAEVNARPLPRFAKLGDQVYLMSEAEGALPIGSRIEKVGAEDEDTTHIGQRGKVLSSIKADPDTAAAIARETGRDARYFYFVEWDWLPGVPVGVVDWKIAAQEPGT